MEMNITDYHFKYPILCFVFAKLTATKLSYKILTFFMIVDCMPVQSAEFNNAARSNNLQNSVISADRLISLIYDSKRDESNAHYLDLDSLNEEASKLISSVSAPPLGHDDLLFDEVNNYAALLNDGDEVVIFILMSDSELKPFSLIAPLDELALFGINKDVSIDDNNLNFHQTNQAALFLWPAHHFDSMEIDSFSSEVAGYLWHGRDKITVTDAGEMITGDLRLSFQNDRAILRFLSSHGASSIYFPLSDLTDFGTLSTTGNFIHNGEDRHSSISLGLLRTNHLDAFLQFKTDKDEIDHHFTGFVTTLPHQAP